MKIVLIDADDMSRDMLSRRLARRGYAVTTAADGVSGLAAVHAEQPDLVVLDASEPGAAGWETARQLTLDSTLRGTPVIATTSYGMPGDRELAEAAGCAAYEVKPIDFDRLVRTIERLVTPAHTV